jgi:TPR repeat protein
MISRDRDAAMAEDSTRTLKDLVAAAQRGDARAQFELGRRHYHGSGAPPDQAAAGRWFRRAADQGHVVARIYLAELAGDDRGRQAGADAGFDRWLKGAVEGMRRSELKRRESLDLADVLKTEQGRKRGHVTLPLALAACLTLAAGLAWWFGGLPHHW